MATITAIPTRMITRMTTDPLLTLTQWLSPAYPVGAFTYSHGLEALVDAGTVHDVQSFVSWITDTLSHGAGQNDVILLAHAYNARDKQALAELDSLARALAPSAERLLETDQQGAAFARTTAAVHALELPALTYPVAVGHAAQLQNLPLAETAQLFLHAFAANLTSAATRLVPLGQTEAQTALAALAPLCQDIANTARRLSLDAIVSSTFVSDIASMRHETQYSRLFRS